jgi:hypothetical protein
MRKHILANPTFIRSGSVSMLAFMNAGPKARKHGHEYDFANPSTKKFRWQERTQQLAMYEFLFIMKNSSEPDSSWIVLSLSVVRYKSSPGVRSTNIDSTRFGGFIVKLCSHPPTHVYYCSLKWQGSYSVFSKELRTIFLKSHIMYRWRMITVQSIKVE